MIQKKVSKQYRQSRMDAEEINVISVGEEHGFSSCIETETAESERCGTEDTGPEHGTEEEADADVGPEPAAGEEIDADADDFEVVQDEDGGNEGGDIEGGDDGEKDDENMVVVDELENDDHKSLSDEGEICSSCVA